MTTIGINDPLTSRTRLRLTRRGRRLAVGIAAFPASVALAAAVIGGTAALASRDAGLPAGSFTTVTVEYGDSLWSIAQEVAPQSDPRDVVDAIVRLNALDSVTVPAGQRLSIPAEYASAR